MLRKEKPAAKVKERRKRRRVGPDHQAVKDKSVRLVGRWFSSRNWFNYKNQHESVIFPSHQKFPLVILTVRKI